MSNPKKIIVIVSVLLVLVIASGYLLPANVSIERQITITVPAENIYPYLSNLRQFNKFSPWAKIDKNTTYIFTGKDGKPGSRMSWDSDNDEVGKGTQTITDLIPNQEVRIALDFGDDGLANSYFKLIPVKTNSTQIVWGFSTNLGNNPLTRYMGLMLDKWVGNSYAEGLQNLKKLAETEYVPVDFSNLKAQVVHVEAVTIVYKKGQVSNDEKSMSEVYRKSYQQLLQYLDITEAQQSSDPMAITTLWDEKNHLWGYKIALPYSGELKLSQDHQLDPDSKDENQPFFEINRGYTYQGKALKVTYIGSYDGLKNEYQKIRAYMKSNRLQQSGDSWEVYVSDPESTPAKELQTDIYFPIK